MNRINIICLGVKNMEESIKFYRDGLGFKTDEVENSPIVIFFNNTGTKRSWPAPQTVNSPAKSRPTNWMILWVDG